MGGAVAAATVAVTVATDVAGTKPEIPDCDPTLKGEEARSLSPWAFWVAMPLSP
jgi:hypothetical protein